MLSPSLVRFVAPLATLTVLLAACGGAAAPSATTAPTAAATTTIWRGWTMRSVPGCASSSPICCATSPVPIPIARISSADSLQQSKD